ncbi:molybdopterin synthase catalytic subunit MoaE [Aliidiomarina celeris]|uniref:molybdopterin synthase catalytic subunit MoaE n=1 Tax=Aliidiomarina celeris TaxID=2249428 RepID=UPI000DEBF2B1|nr:molybdopterin synthase catalytic subunit MoaE [Aliidiomarina celeris]
MAATTTIRIQEQDFSVADNYEQLRRSAAYGAVVTFTGLVRELVDAQLSGMFLEHYPGMTEKALQGISNEARQRWQLGPIQIIHRIGHLQLNDQIVFVGVAAKHRADAFAASMFLMDFLKTRAPFWKKEVTKEASYWVEAKESDQHAVQRWNDQK